jgi:methylated-DNA-[protein]-cysteine S-methyltransferase
MKNIFFYPTEIGQIGIAEEDNKITNVFFETDQNTYGDPMTQGFCINNSDVIREAWNQLDEYFNGRRKSFDLPLAPSGTDFMKNVWSCLCNIPYGQTRSYREIAEAAGNSKACRAVGMANNKNPIPIFIPCHRVIGTNGSLTGYRGGVEAKQKLLELEKLYSK